MKKQGKNPPWDLLNPFSHGEKYEVYHLSNTRLAMPEFHNHDFFEIYFFLSGDTSIVIEEFTYKTSPGDIFIFPPGRFHRAQHHSEQSYYERFVLYISPETLMHMSAEDYPVYQLLLQVIAKNVLHIHPKDEEFNKAISIMNDIIMTSADADSAQRMINDCKMCILITLISKWFAQQPDADMSVQPRALAPVISYIDTNLDKDLSLDALSAQFFINKYHLLREFKSYAEVTLYQYILQKRITHAKNLLRSGTPPALVCTQCGFKDYSSFYKAFKKQTSLSPRQYVGLTQPLSSFMSVCENNAEV